MRELTKSMLSYTWAMSVFGMRQITVLLQPQRWGDAAAAFDTVNRCTDDQLGPVTRSTFRAADSLQRGMVDLMFSFFSPGAFLPRSGRDSTFRGDNGWCTGCGDPGTAGSANRMGAMGNATNPFVGLGIDLLQQGVNAASATYQAMGAAGGQQRRGESGWGPVPPPPSA